MSYTRELLEPDALLKLRAEETDEEFEFRIKGTEGEPGSSAVCYRAERVSAGGEWSIPGTLKEFCPRQLDGSDLFSFHLVRSSDPNEAENGQLRVAGKLTRDNFFRVRDAFRNAYGKVRAAKNRNPSLYEPIANFELLRSAPMAGDPENYTVYVWTPYDVHAVLFRDFLAQVCKDTANNEKKITDLQIILKSIRDLAGAVKALHLTQLLHLDISPGNFGIKPGDNGPSGRITLFDINSVFSASDISPLPFSGTPGFRSPALLRGAPRSQKMDLFSIGACLFYALVMSPDKAGKLKNVYFLDPAEEQNAGAHLARWGQIGTLLSASPLFNDCDDTEDTSLQTLIAAILKKCLAPAGAESYDGAAPLIEDLDRAIAALNLKNDSLYYEGDGRIARVTLSDKEEAAARKTRLGAAGAIQMLLYEHPLYRHTDPDGSLNILVLGCGVYGSKFVDLALQLTQTEGCRTRVTVASKDMDADRTRFLHKRPGFADFFSVDGAPAKRTAANAPYGEVDFIPLTEREAFGKNAPEKNRRTVEKICRQTGLSYRFVFIAMHADTLNFAAAQACEAVFGTDAAIHYVLFGDTLPDSAVPALDLQSEAAKKSGAIPIEISRTVDLHGDYPALRRMAFNIHLTWTGTLEHLDQTAEQFAKAYHTESSFSAALALKYKLHSVGLPFEPQDPAHTAEAFRKWAADGDNAESLQMLFCCEHRRWIAQCVASGMRTLPEEELCRLTDSNKDTAGKRHPCMVDAGPLSPLETPEWQEKAFERWDLATEEELGALDDLDRMSVLLHRHFKALAKQKLTDAVPELTRIFDELERLLPDDGGIRHAYTEYRDTVNVGVYDTFSSPPDLDSYNYYKRSLLRLLETRKPAPEKAWLDRLKECIDRADSEIFPIVQAKKHTVWKALDRDLILRLPFILTYRSDWRLMIPLTAPEKGRKDTTGLFNNAAAALMLNPESVVYVLTGEHAARDTDGVRQSLSYAVKLMESHALQTKIDILILQSAAHGRLSPEIKQAFKGVSKKIRYVETVKTQGRDLRGGLEAYLRSKENTSRRITAIELNDTRVSGALGACTDPHGAPYPCYTFRSEDQTFDCDPALSCFNDVPFKPSLRVDDLFVPQEKYVIFDEPELKRDYSFFWKLYKPETCRTPEAALSAARSWKQLCSRLKAGRRDRLMQLSLGAALSKEKATVFFPAECRRSVEWILNQAIKVGAVEKTQQPLIVCRSSNLICVSFLASPSVREAIKGLACVPEKLRHPERLSCYALQETLIFEYDDLRLYDLRFTPGAEGGLIELMNKLSAAGCIAGFRSPQSADQAQNVVCCSPQVKHLLTNEGSVLELFLYYRAIASGCFHDVKTGCTVNWNNGNLLNEFDVVATKGFRTYIFECKATDEIRQDHFNKLFALTQIFGINNRAYLVADLCGRVSAANALQLTRSEEFGIPVLCEAEALTPRGLQAAFSEMTGTPAPGDHR